MKYSQVIIFQDWKELEVEMFKSLRMFGVKEGSIIKRDGEGPKLSILGEVPTLILNLMGIKRNELSDYEGIDDETKKISHVFPLEICSKLLIDIFGFEGRFMEIPSKIQDPTSGKMSTNIIFLSDDKIDNRLNEQVSERIEATINIVDFENDDKEYIKSLVLECLLGITNDLGNKNLRLEIESMFYK